MSRNNRLALDRANSESTLVVRLFTVLCIALALSSTAVWAQPGPQDTTFGVLVMAHGGKEAWDEAVLMATRPLDIVYPVEVAFGMASAETLQEAISNLEAQGVSRIGVVRLFISGESWLERTGQILGLLPGAPTPPESPASHQKGGHHDLEATFWRIESDAAFALSRDGLSQSDAMSEILVDRARELSVDPEHESVLILAHGPGDDGENERWLANLDRLAEPLRQEFPFRAVEVQTLREDWAEKREVAEQRIRSFVEDAGTEGGRCLVIPFRVFGFGPYGEVLEGLDYESNGQGLLPHELISNWLLNQAEALSEGPFEPALSALEEPPPHSH